MKRALITGCAGFIGSHLADRLLKEGYEVIGIDCFTDYYSRGIKEANIKNALQDRKFKLVRADIGNIGEFPQVDIVFHLAAQPGVRASWGKTFSIYSRNNIDATQYLLEYYKDRDIKKFVYASSSSVYGNTDLPARETSPLRPISPYGVTKLAGENLCYLYYKNFNVPVTMLRYFTVYGPRQRPDMAINKFFRALLSKKTIEIYGDGTQTRDFTYVEDVINATIAAGLSEVNGEAFNIGGGSRISINDLISLIKEITGNPVSVKHTNKQKGDVIDTLADISKAQKILGWNIQTNIRNGLQEYAQWYSEHNL